LRSLVLAFFLVLLSASQAWSLQGQGALEFQAVEWDAAAETGSKMDFYVVETDGETGEVLPPNEGDQPIGSTSLSGRMNATRTGQAWTVTLLDMAAETVTIVVPIGPVLEMPAELSNITLSMPFEGVPGTDGVPRTVSSVAGVDDGSSVSFVEEACVDCEDFGASFAASVDGGAIEEVALVDPLVLALGEEDGTITLRGVLSAGIVKDVGVTAAFWIEAQLDLLQVPEPGLGLLQVGALLPLVVLARRRRRSRR
jgi:hypothetical protein